MSLRSYIQDLRSCRDDEPRSAAARALRSHVQSEARGMFGDRLVGYMRDLNAAILELVESPITQEKLGGIAAIDELISLETEENATKISRFAANLRASLPHTVRGPRRRLRLRAPSAPAAPVLPSWDTGSDDCLPSDRCPCFAVMGHRLRRLPALCPLLLRCRAGARRRWR